jgi:hypothetical protein
MSFAIVVAIGTAQPAIGQVVDEALARTVRPGQQIFVTTRTAGEKRGRFVRVSSGAVVLTSDGAEQSIPLADVGWIERRGDPLWNGALIGAGVFGFAMAAGAGASCSPNCASTVTGGWLLGGAFGAGVGTLLDAAIRGRTLVYGRRPDRTHRASTTHSGAARAPIETPEPNVATPDTHQLFASLWSRVEPGDRITIRLSTAGEIQGTFRSVSESSVTVLVGDTARDIPGADVLRITRHRGGTHVRRGLLIGASVGALAGSAPCYSVDDTKPVIPCGGAVLLGAAAGGVAGALLGRATFGKTVVYEAAPDTRTSAAAQRPGVRLVVAPVAAPRVVGVFGSCTF